MSNKKYLDNTGLNTVWNLIKNNFVDKQDFDSFGNYKAYNTDSLYAKNFKKISYNILDNGGKDVYVLISDLTEWENPVEGKITNNYIIGTICCKRGGNMQHTGIYNIVGVAASYNMKGSNSPHSNYSLYVDNAISTSENLEIHKMVTPYIIEYNGIKWLALKKTGSGTEIFFDGLISSDVKNWYQITEPTELAAVTEVYKPNYTNAYALTTETYFDGTNNHNLIHSGNLNLYLLQEVTYNELVKLKNNNKLVPGQQYRITDYVTTTNGNESSSSAGHQFDIIVEAITTNTLNENAKACHHKYFTESIIPDSPNSPDKMLSNVTVAHDIWVNISNDEFTNELQTLLTNNSIPNPVMDNVRKICITEYNNGAGGGYKIDCKAGSIAVKFKWQTNSGSKKINMCGVTLKDAVTDTVVSTDYHIGSAGTSDINNKYLLHVPKNGEYYIDCFIIKHNSQKYDYGEIDSTVAISAYQLTPYFENSKLLSWDIKYCLENDSTRFKWAKSGGKGVIYYMKDEYNNQASFDFKNIRFDNKYVFNYSINDVNYDGTVNYGNTVCYNNSIGLDISDGKLGFPKIYFNNTSENSECHNNIIEKNCWKITFGNGCFNNTIYNNSENITFSDGCTHNTIYQNCDTNSFGKNSTFNILYQGCEENHFGESCSNNILNEGCLYNTFGTQCINNVLSNDCKNNYFGDKCCDNIFGRMCSYNRFTGDCNSNILGNECLYNEFGQNCYENIFKDNCGYSNKKNIFGNYCFANEFGEMCRGNVFGNNCSQNKFGNYCWDNKFGNSVYANKFGIDCSNIEIRMHNSEKLLDFVTGFEFGNYCRKLYIYPPYEITTTKDQELRNFNFSNNLGNTSSYTNIILTNEYPNVVNNLFHINVGYNSTGNIVQKCLMNSNISENYNNGKLTISII